LLKDERDKPILYLIINILVFMFPGSLLVYTTKSNIIGFLVWIINLILFQERFLIGLHYHAHKNIFKSRILNDISFGVISPFFGIPVGLYHLHHVVMHHKENNKQGWDLSSTEPYQRDSFSQFVIYWMRFICLIWFELPYYAIKRKRILPTIVSITAVSISAIIIINVNHTTLWLFIIPTIFNSFILMLGNWSQHIFINPSKPRSSYHLTYNVINDECNQRSFNDGYHIEHHLHPGKHWSELPSSFEKNIEKYAREDAIVFQRIDPIKVGILVFMQRYDMLAEHIIQWKPRSKDEIEAFLRERLKPIRHIIP
jgi:fatty acid desaturase